MKTAFPPILGPEPRVLILGSMPGDTSLAKGEYYGHTHNAFWPIMGNILGFEPNAPYPERTAALMRHRIALWDVIASCERPGSLDSSIRHDSVEVNDFATLLNRNPSLTRILFNGRGAEQAFRRHAVAQLNESSRAIKRVYLPSTSPAYAGMRFTEKLAAWREGVG